MTTEETILYEPFRAHIETREESVHQAQDAMTRAIHIRNALGIAVGLYGALRLCTYFVSGHSLDWAGANSLVLTSGLLGGWLLAAANAWCCQQRLNESQDFLRDYVNRLPTAK